MNRRSTRKQYDPHLGQKRAYGSKDTPKKPAPKVEPDYRIVLDWQFDADEECQIVVHLRHHVVGDTVDWWYPSIYREFPDRIEGPLYFPNLGHSKTAAEAFENAAKTWWKDSHQGHWRASPEFLMISDSLYHDYYSQGAWWQAYMRRTSTRPCPKCGEPMPFDHAYFVEDMAYPGYRRPRDNDPSEPSYDPHFVVTLYWKCKSRTKPYHSGLVSETICSHCNQPTEFETVRSENSYVLPGSTGAGADVVKRCKNCGAEVKIWEGWAD